MWRQVMINARESRYICKPCLFYRMCTQLEMWQLFNLEPLIIVTGVHENDCQMYGHFKFIDTIFRKQYDLLMDELRNDEDYQEMEVG